MCGPGVDQSSWERKRIPTGQQPSVAQMVDHTQGGARAPPEAGQLPFQLASTPQPGSLMRSAPEPYPTITTSSGKQPSIRTECHLRHMSLAADGGNLTARLWIPQPHFLGLGDGSGE